MCACCTLLARAIHSLCVAPRSLLQGTHACYPPLLTCCPPSPPPQDSDPDAEDVKRTSRREVALLRSLQHPNVVEFVDEFMVRDRLFIVMGYVPCNLLELLEAQPGGMDKEAVRLIMYQLCTAITYIHGKVSCPSSS